MEVIPVEYESSDDEDGQNFNLTKMNVHGITELIKKIWELTFVCSALCNAKTNFKVRDISRFDKKFRYNSSHKGAYNIIKYPVIDSINEPVVAKASRVENGEGCVKNDAGYYVCDEELLYRSSYLLNTPALTKEIKKKLKSLRGMYTKLHKVVDDAFHFTSDDIDQLQNGFARLYDIRLLIKTLAYAKLGTSLKVVNNSAHDKLTYLENTTFPTHVEDSFKVKYDFVNLMQSMKCPSSFTLIVVLPPKYDTLLNLSELNIDELQNINGYAYFENEPLVFVKKSQIKEIYKSIYLYNQSIQGIAHNNSKVREIPLVGRNSILRFSTL